MILLRLPRSWFFKMINHVSFSVKVITFIFFFSLSRSWFILDYHVSFLFLSLQIYNVSNGKNEGNHQPRSAATRRAPARETTRPGSDRAAPSTRTLRRPRPTRWPRHLTTDRRLLQARHTGPGKSAGCTAPAPSWARRWRTWRVWERKP